MIKKASQLFLIFCTGSNLFGQDKKNAIAVSVSELWNKYTVANVIGPHRDISGEGQSSSIAFSYSKYLYKGLFIKAETGICKQRYNIQRPFLYSSSNFLLYTTQYYYYLNLQPSIGAGYDIALGKSSGVQGLIDYAMYYSIKEYFKPMSNDKAEVNNRFYSFGNSLRVNLSYRLSLTEQFEILFDTHLPIFTRWHKDSIFGEDDRDYTSTKSSLGLGISLHYKF